MMLTNLEVSFKYILTNIINRLFFHLDSVRGLWYIGEHICNVFSKRLFIHFIIIFQRITNYKNYCHRQNKSSILKPMYFYKSTMSRMSHWRNWSIRLGIHIRDPFPVDRCSNRSYTVKYTRYMPDGKRIPFGY